jgi:hypothetical protein
VPFDFLKRKKTAEPVATAAPPTTKNAGGVPFDAVTEDWRIVGRMMVKGRLSDALNKRDPIDIVDVTWAPIDGSGTFEPAPGLKTVDPYDLVLVVASDDSLPDLTDSERAAHKVHKVSYEVALEVPPYRVVGTVLLYPGSEPERLLDRASDMFIPVVGATATMAGSTVGPTDADVILVNRAYLRGVEQVDARTGERHEKLPGGSMGGTNWTDRSR